METPTSLTKSCQSSSLSEIGRRGTFDLSQNGLVFLKLNRAWIWVGSIWQGTQTARINELSKQVGPAGANFFLKKKPRRCVAPTAQLTKPVIDFSTSQPTQKPMPTRHVYNPFLHVTSRQLFLWQRATWPQWLADRWFSTLADPMTLPGSRPRVQSISPRHAQTLFQWQCSTWHEWLAETQTVRSSTLAGQMTLPESRSDQRLQVNLDPF